MTLAAEPVGSEPVGSEPVGSQPVSSRPAVDPVRWPRLVEVLDALTPVEHRAVTAVYFEGRTFRETADLLAVDVRAVSRAIAAVRRPVADHVIVGVEG